MGMMWPVALLAGCTTVVSVPSLPESFRLELPDSRAVDLVEPGPLEPLPMPDSDFAEEDWTLTASISEKAFSIAANYYYEDEISLGAMLQLGTGKDDYVAPSFIAKRFFDIGDFDDLTGYVLGGLGFYSGDSEFEVMISAGGGLDYRIGDDMAIGTSLIYNIFPSSDQKSFSTWYLMTFTIKF